MADRINSSGNYCPRSSDEPLTPWQDAKCREARDPNRTAQQRQKAMEPSANPVEANHWDEHQLQKGESEVGERARAASATVVNQMVVGSKAELTVTGKIGHGVELTGKGSLEVVREPERWLVSETVGAGAELAEHAGSYGEAGVGISGEWKRTYSYSFSEGAVIGMGTALQKPVPDELVDVNMNIQEQKLANRLVSESFAVSADFFAGTHAGAGAVGVSGEAKLGSTAKVAVDYESGHVVVESAVEGSGRISLGAGAGGIGTSTDVMAANVAEKIETTYLLTSSEAERFKQTHDAEIIKAAVHRGAKSEKLVQDIKVAVADKTFCAKREVELDGHTRLGAARKLDGLELSWSEAAFNRNDRLSIPFGVGSVKVETKVEHPGVLVMNGTIEELAEHAFETRSTDEQVTARRAFANIHH